MPMSRHGGEEFVLCVELNGAVNVEQARGEECAGPERPEQESTPRLHLDQSSPEHCVDCVDVPLTLAEAHEPCESAVLPAVVLDDQESERLASEGQNLAASDRHAANVPRYELRPRAPEESGASFRRQEGHLFSDTSIVRAQSSVELLI